MNNLNVLMINGSPRKDANSLLVCKEMKKIFNNNGIDTEIISIGNKDIRGCTACYSCSKTNKCVFDDIVNEIAPKFEKADGLVVTSPVYFASPNGSVISLLDRLFCSTNFNKTMKVGASVSCARRGGTTATLDVINKYFTFAGMPVASSSYWNIIHGASQNEAIKDEEGIQTIRNLAENMSFLIKSINLGKEKFDVPDNESKIKTNFIR